MEKEKKIIKRLEILKREQKQKTPIKQGELNCMCI